MRFEIAATVVDPDSAQRSQHVNADEVTISCPSDPGVAIVGSTKPERKESEMRGGEHSGSHNSIRKRIELAEIQHGGR